MPRRLVCHRPALRLTVIAATITVTLAGGAVNAFADQPICVKVNDRTVACV